MSIFEELLHRKKTRANDEEFWDNKSIDFERSFPDIKECKDIFVFETLENNNILKNVNSVVDIGCGIGRHSYHFAQYVDRYVGIDISAGMLDVANKNKDRFCLDNCEFQKIVWQECQEKFDLVFASMCPAIKDVSDVKKLLDMSNRYVVIRRFLNETTDLFQELDIKENFAHVNVGYSYGIINILWQLSYVPQVFARHEEKQKVFALDDILNGKRIMLDYLTDEQKEEKIKLLEQKADSKGNIKTVLRQDYALIVVDKQIVNTRFDVNEFLEKKF